MKPEIDIDQLERLAEELRKRVLESRDFLERAEKIKKGAVQRQRSILQALCNLQAEARFGLLNPTSPEPPIAHSSETEEGELVPKSKIGEKAKSNSKKTVKKSTKSSRKGKFGDGHVPKIRHIDAMELKSVPKYMRGRITLQKLNEAIDELHAAAVVKYKLLAKSYHKLRDSEHRKVAEYRKMENEETKGKQFVCDTDLCFSKCLRRDGTGRAVVLILRNLNRIKRARGKASRYILCTHHAPS